MNSTAPCYLLRCMTYLVAGCLIILSPLSSMAGELVSASYQSMKEGRLVLLLQVKSPPPSSIIVIQQVPAGTEVMSSSPPHQKISKNGEIKWLIKDPEPGDVTIELTTTPPVDPREVTCEIRYRDPVTNEMKTTGVAPQ